MSDKEYKGRYTVIGPPGTGKTTWLAKQVDAVVDRLGGANAERSPVLVCSLTKTAATEVVRQGLPVPRAAVATIHAHGYRSQGRPDMVNDENITSFNEQHRAFEITTAGKDGDASQLGSMSNEHKGNAFFSEYNRLRHCMIPIERWPQGVAAFALAWNAWKRDSELIDFTDQIELADTKPPMNPSVIIVDEAQDTSALEFNLLLRWADYAGAFIAVGDPWQALYTWRGASPAHLVNDSSARGTDRYRVLARSYRIPRAVHAAATDWVRQLSDWEPIEYKPRDDDGLVDTCDATLNNPTEAIRRSCEYISEGNSVLLAATCNRHLDKIAGMLRSEAVPFSNPWRKHNGKWNPLTGRRGNSPALTVTSLMASMNQDGKWNNEQLWSWSRRFKARQMFRHGAKKQIESAAKDKPMSFVTHNDLDYWFGDKFKEMQCAMSRTPRDLLQWYMENLPRDESVKIRYPAAVWCKHGESALTDEPKLHVGTVHSVKGGEADIVFLFPDLGLPAMRGWLSERDASMGRDDVVRTIYVGMTRARQQLYLCRPSSRLHVPWPKLKR